MRPLILAWLFYSNSHSSPPSQHSRQTVPPPLYRSIRASSPPQRFRRSSRDSYCFRGKTLPSSSVTRCRTLRRGRYLLCCFVDTLRLPSNVRERYQFYLVTLNGARHRLSSLPPAPTAAISSTRKLHRHCSRRQRLNSQLPLPKP